MASDPHGCGTAFNRAPLCFSGKSLSSLSSIGQQLPGALMLACMSNLAELFWFQAGPPMMGVPRCCDLVPRAEPKAAALERCRSCSKLQFFQAFS